MNIKFLPVLSVILLMQNNSLKAQELDAFGLENMNAVNITASQAVKNNTEAAKNDSVTEKEPNKLEKIKKNIEMIIKRGPADVPETDKKAEEQSPQEEALTEEELELAKIMNPDEPKAPESKPEDSEAPAEEEIVAAVPENVSVQPKPQSLEKTEAPKETTKEERSLEYLMFNMNLSDEQLVKIQQLNEASTQKMNALMEKIKQLRQEARDVESQSLNEFETVLTNEQKEKFRSLRLMYESNRANIKKLDPEIVSLGE